MRSLVCQSPFKLQYQDLVPPILQTGRAIIKINRVGICGTDLHGFEGTQPYFNYPRILGHELSGHLVDADDAENFVPGEAVTIVPYYHCGSCIACRNGKPNCCVNLNVCGVHIDGGMVDYLSVPSCSLVHGDGLSLDELAMVEPFGIGAHGVRRAAVQKDEFVLVCGAGPIGLATMEFARIGGAQVIAVDTNQARLDFCEYKLGFSFLINPMAVDLEHQVRLITKGDYASVVIDATGNQQAINGGLRLLAHGGRYVLIGLQKNEIVFSHPEFHKRETTLLGSRNATREDFEMVISCVKKRLIVPTEYITHRAAFEDVAEHFGSWLNPSAGVIKAMVEF